MHVVIETVYRLQEYRYSGRWNKSKKPIRKEQNFTIVRGSEFCDLLEKLRVILIKFACSVTAGHALEKRTATGRS